jgi:hypothetical protein
LTRINVAQSIFLNHASLRKHLREMDMAQTDQMGKVNTGARKILKTRR